MRLDIYLTENGLCKSRTAAQSLIKSGGVSVDGKPCIKSSYDVADGAAVEITGEQLRYVGRGGLKLEGAISAFGIQLAGFVCLDIGASTGGFTDCMLQNGASKVYSIDVGYGQLAWKLRSDERVVNLERTNFRYVTHENIPDEPDFASVDVSFISLKHILPVMHSLLCDGGRAVCLIKPQFEAGRDKVGKKGVVRDPEVHKEVIENTVALALDTGFSVLGLDFSPVKGPEGNIEYLMYIEKCEEGKALDTAEIISQIDALVLSSHATLDK